LHRNQTEEAVHSFPKSIKQKTMEENKVLKIEHQLERIERYSLLAAKNVLNIGDVALLTGFSKATIYMYTCNKKIPHYKQGNTLFFDRQEIEDWLKQNRIATAKEIDQNATNYVVTGRMRKGGAAL
jgi:excisionase family DNA binding protein